MGIVLRQSLWNTVVTYLGFAVAAVNTLFLYTRFLTDEYYGLVTVILSTSAILMPILAFGVPNTLVKYFSHFETPRDQDGFLTMMLLLPLTLIGPIAGIAYFAEAAIGRFLARENPMVGNYVWYIFLIGVAMAYFEVFYALAKVRMRTVFGNFMKEVFHRAGVMILLFLVYLDVLSVDQFLKALVGLYLVRTVVMMLNGYSLQTHGLSFAWPRNRLGILQYSALIILGGSAAVIILEIDKVMINQFIQIENVAYYGVAVYIATTVIVPSRAMHQITYPMTAELLNRKDMGALKALYQRSSLTLFIVSGFIFVLILVNLNDLYQLLPEAYRGGFTIVLLIGLAKVFDSLLGNNNSILYNSDYYRSLLVFGALLALSVILFNLWLIPRYGIEGAAMGTFLAIVLYNTIKLLYVWIVFRLQPFTVESGKVLALLLLTFAMFYLLTFPFHPIANMVIKTLLVGTFYVGVLYRFRISEDVFGVLSKFLGRRDLE